MNDVKDICDAALEVPAPPLREATTALAMARSSTRRRNAFTGAAAAAAVLLVSAAVAAPRLLATPAQPSRGAAAASAPAPSLVAPPAVPTWQQAHANGQRTADALFAAIPAGYSAAAEWRSADGPASTWLVESDNAEPTARYISTTNIVVSRDGHEGLLGSVLRRDDVPASDADLCSAEVTARVAPVLYGVTDNCQVTVIHGVAIRTSTGHTQDLGEVIVAVRVLDGGYLAVMASEGSRVETTDGSDAPSDAVNRHPSVTSTAPALTAPFMTAAQVAALAADPALLP